MGSGEDGLAGCGLGHHGGKAHGHGAVVGTVTAAAGRQDRVIAGGEERRERPQPEDQNQEDGKGTPHLEIYLIGRMAG